MTVSSGAVAARALAVRPRLAVLAGLLTLLAMLLTAQPAQASTAHRPAHRPSAPASHPQPAAQHATRHTKVGQAREDARQRAAIRRAKARRQTQLCRDHARPIARHSQDKRLHSGGEHGKPDPQQAGPIGSAGPPSVISHPTDPAAAKAAAAKTAAAKAAAAKAAAAKAAAKAAAAKAAALAALQVRSIAAHRALASLGGSAFTLGSAVSVADAPRIVAGRSVTRPVTGPASTHPTPATPSRAAPDRPNPVLALPTQIAEAGLSVGAGPAVLLALVLLVGLALVVAGTRRRTSVTLH
ncbi:MAG: hypothetical protein ACR2N4_07860 [Jatrophihabitans sp.]